MGFGEHSEPKGTSSLCTRSEGGEEVGVVKYIYLWSFQDVDQGTIVIAQTRTVIKVPLRAELNIIIALHME